MKKTSYMLGLGLAACLLMGCQTNYADNAFGAKDRYESQQYDPTYSSTGVENSIRNPVTAQPGINKDSDPSSTRRP